MSLNTVIFDMDGLLIDSEPLWKEAAQEVFGLYNIVLTDAQYASTTGLRTREFVLWWLTKNDISESECENAEQKILNAVIEKVEKRGNILPGVGQIFNFLRDQKFKIGLASSSPTRLIDVVVDKLGIRNRLHAIASAENLRYGKPHPQVYLNCAIALDANPAQCLCFEDSFNGMIAALAARMKCVIVPAYHQYKEERWSAAHFKLSSLQNFSQLHLNILNEQP